MIVIRKSCLNGKIVWVWRGKSRHSARTAYYRACKQEVERVRHWGETAAQRRRNLLRTLTECMADMALTDEMAPEQIAMANIVKRLSEEDFACHTEFYEHIMEERRRRKAAREAKEKEKMSSK